MPATRKSTTIKIRLSQIRASGRDARGWSSIWTDAVWVALGDELGRSGWHGCVLSCAAPAPWHTCAGSAPMDRGHLQAHEEPACAAPPERERLEELLLSPADREGTETETVWEREKERELKATISMGGEGWSEYKILREETRRKCILNAIAFLGRLRTKADLWRPRYTHNKGFFSFVA